MTKKIKNPTKLKANKKSENSKFLNFKNIDSSLEPAIYYGFTPINAPQIEKEDRDRVKNLKENEPLINIGTNKKNFFTLEEISAILRNYFKMYPVSIPQLSMLAYNYDNSTVLTKQKKLVLEILGSNKSISEAILIKTIIAILTDAGYKNLYVEINSLGDRESCSRFNRELTNYFRKNINTMQAHCRQSFKKDPFLVLSCDNDKCQLMKENAPKAISCLSDESREYFKEVLEYLESLDIPYKINDCLVSDKRYASDTVFEIKQKSDRSRISDESLATGFRCDSICKKLGFKKEIPMIGAKIYFMDNADKKSGPKIKKSSVFLIQLGDEAKHKSLKVIDILRNEGIFVNHSLGRDKMTGQMLVADRSKVPYVLIMGKKEAMDDTIMVRDMATRSQETIKISDLAIYLKKLVK